MIKTKNIVYYLFIILFFLVTGINKVEGFSTYETHNPINVEQILKDKKITLNISNKPLKQVLDDIIRQTGIGFSMHDDVEKTMNISVNVKDVSINEALDVILKNTPFKYQIYGNTVAIVLKNEVKQNKHNQKVKEKVTLRGTVIDGGRQPLVGAIITVAGTAKGTITDDKGGFRLDTHVGERLEVAYVGYNTGYITVEANKNDLLISLKEDVVAVDDVVVVAYGTQSKESLIGSVTSVKARDLKSSNSDLTSQFAGKIAGIIGWQTGGIPGVLTEEDMNTKFYIRGITSFQTDANIDPLILIDGVESSKLDLSRIPSEDIESFNVLKDALATAMYGARGANGVIIVTTKKGKEGSVYTSVRYEAIASMSTRDIDIIDPVEYMNMYNRALISRDPTASPKYDLQKIERSGSPDYPSFVYPVNDWKKILMKDFSINHHIGLTIRGGSRILQYYASVNHNQDFGMIKTDRLNDFKTNISSGATSFRANLTINLAKGIQVLINSITNMDQSRGPFTSNVKEIYGMAFTASPVDFAPTYPADEVHVWPHIRFGGTELKQRNPYKDIHRGYTEQNRYSTANKVEYIQDLSSVIKGLEFRANVSIQQIGYTKTPYTTIPFEYALPNENYDFETGKFILKALNPQLAIRTLSVYKSGAISQTQNQISYDARLLHTAAWGNHQSSITAVFSGMQLKATPVSSVLLGMPHRNLGLSFRASYGYKSRYFMEGSFGYNGSERFHKRNKMGFFPAAGVAWVISNENFMKNISKTISFAKLRLSWGQVGNDGVIKDPRFVYLPEIKTENTSSPLPGTQYIQRVLVSAYANPNIRWEVAEKLNLGFETKLFNNVLEINADIFQEVRHNIISPRTTVPSIMGIEIPILDNIGKGRTRGFDISAKLQKAITKDLWFICNGTITYSKSEYLSLEEPTDRPSWQRRVGNEISQQIGYIAQGLFTDYAEIENAPKQGGELMPGDIRYKDINNDGKVDINDATYIGYPETPRLIYGFSTFLNFKAFEFGMSFQGSGQRSLFMNASKISPFANDNAMLKAIYNDHWNEDNMKTMPFWPRLSTKNIVEHNPQEAWKTEKSSEIRKSTYFMREARFLRCTSIEFSYSLPSRLTQKIKLQNFKLTLRANNPFLISQFKIWDVELGNNGFNYPIQRTFSLGVSASF